MDKSEFADYSADEFRAALGLIREEIVELNQKKVQLGKDRKTIETVMYMMFPEEAVRDGTLDPTATVAQRLRRARESMEAAPKPICLTNGCKGEVLCKGKCYDCYHQEKRKAAPSERSKILMNEAMGRAKIPQMPPVTSYRTDEEEDPREGLKIKTISRP